MPATQVVFYRELDGTCPVVEWLRGLRKRDKVAHARCRAVIQRLRESGYDLRRPTADFLRDGIYELRAHRGKVEYRILYFFHGKNIAILAHAITKEDKVPKKDIDRALHRRMAFKADPAKRTYME